MHKQFMKDSAIVAVSMMSFVYFTIGAAKNTPILANNNHGECSDGIDIEPQSGDLFEYSTDSEEVVNEICIKSGQIGHTDAITTDGTYSDGCYLVSGIGTNSITVSRVGEPGRECQEISHVDIVTGSVETSPEPTPETSPNPETSPEVSPTPEASPEVTPTPEASPEVSPTPEATPETSPTPNPSDEEQENEDSDNNSEENNSNSSNDNNSNQSDNSDNESNDSNNDDNSSNNSNQSNDDSSDRVLGAASDDYQAVDSYAATGVMSQFMMQVAGMIGSMMMAVSRFIKRN